MKWGIPLPKIARVAATVVLVLLGLAVAFRLGWLAINLFDERLTPAATALLAPHPDPLPDSENIYLAFVGFDAPSGQSVMAAGKARIEAYDRVRERILVDPGAAAADVGSLRPPKLIFKGNIQSWRFLTSSIWSTARTHRAEIATLMTANQELYQRYLATHELRGYFDTAQPGSYSPNVFYPLYIRELFLADVASRLQTGTPSQRQAALAELQQDIRMWKAVLDGEGDLLSKMIAALSLHADFLLLGDMVTDPNFDPAPLGERWDALFTLFNLEDWKIGDAYGWEMRESAPFFELLARSEIPRYGSNPRPTQWWRRVDNRAQFFKLNATENLEAERVQRLRALADGDPGSLIERRDLYRSWDLRRFHRGSWVGWYNPIGRTLLAIGPSNDDYPARVLDVAAFQRLVYLAYQIRQQCIALKDISTFMKEHPEWSTHPIDAKPFYWNPAGGTLGVVPVGYVRQGTRFSLELVGFFHSPCT